MDKLKKKTLVELLKKRERSRVYDLSLRLGNIKLYQYILFENYRDLMDIIEKYEREWGEDKPHIFSEYSRSLFNYLSSVYSLITASEYFRDYIRNPDFTREYQKQLDHMEGKGCGGFVKELRNCMIHGKLFPITPSLSFDPRTTSFKKLSLKDSLQYILGHPKIIFDLKRVFSYARRKFLNKRITFQVFIGLKATVGLEKQFLNSDTLHAPVKNYLRKFGDIIDVKVVIKEYQEFVMTFYEWFYEKIVQLHSKEIEEYCELEVKINRLLDDETSK